jgi:Concanavalin A-like lectin/glucanases superfamily
MKQTISNPLKACISRLFILFLLFITGSIYALTPDWSFNGPMSFDGATTQYDAGTVPGSAPSLTLSFKMTANKLAYMVPIDKFPSTGTAGWAIKLRLNGDLWFLLGSSASANTTCVVTKAYAVGVPVNVCCTFTAGTCKIYINGVLKFTKTGLIQTVNEAATNLRLGIPSKVSTTEKFSGTLENVRIFNTAISDSDVVNVLYNRLPAQHTLSSSMLYSK